MFYLYDPRTNQLTETTYASLEELTGMSRGALASLKSRKQKFYQGYLTDDKVTVQQRKIWYEKEKYHNEVWKTVQGSEEKFLISNYGRFKRVYKNHTGFLLPFLHKKTGLLRIKVNFNGIYTQYQIAKLVALHFVGTPKDGEVLHHKNLIKTDNFSGNLEFISRELLGKKTGRISKSKPVVQLTIETKEVLEEFRSAREAGRQCYLSYQAVLDNCNRKTKTSGGYIFMFTEDYEKSFDLGGLYESRTHQFTRS